MLSIQRYLPRREDLEASAKALGVYDTQVDGYIRLVYTRQQDTPWKYCIGQCVLGNNAGDDLKEDYPTFTFVSSTLFRTTLRKLLDSLANESGLEVARGLPPLRLPTTHSNWREEIVPGHATATGMPVRRFRVNIESNAVLANDQLIAYDLPYRPSAANHIKAFLGLKPQDSVDGQKGEFIIDIPDVRGAIRMSNGVLSIVDAAIPLRLVGEIDGIPVDLRNDGVFEVADKNIRGVELWLLAGGSELVDYISTTHWPYTYAVAPLEAEQEQKFLDLIGKGESETCEFKPYVDLASAKATEIEKSVCAFSNQRGGTMFLGVSKEAEIDGLAKELAKSPDQLDAAIAGYVRQLKSRLQESLKDNQCFSLKIVRLLSTSLVVIEIEKAREVNYLLRSGVMNLAYIRHGATSMRMSPPEIRAMPTQGSGLFGQQLSSLLDS
jgi:hypothetical protein